jgi:hypothetical protein
MKGIAGLGRFLLKGAVVIKLSVVAVGYVIHTVAVPTGERGRRKYLEMAEDILAKLPELGIELEPERRESIEADITLLRRNIRGGWRTEAEVYTFFRLVAFIYHTEATSAGKEFGKLTNAYVGKPIVNAWDDLTIWTGENIGKPVSKFFDSLATTVPPNQDGNIRQF